MKKLIFLLFALMPCFYTTLYSLIEERDSYRMYFSLKSDGTAQLTRIDFLVDEHLGSF